MRSLNQRWRVRQGPWALVLALALLPGLAEGDSAWDNWQGGNPFCETNDAQCGGFSSPRDSNVGNRFDRSGPLSDQAAQRAEQDRNALSGISNGGAQQVAQQPLMAACTTGKCTPAQKAALVAQATAMAVQSTASSRMMQEIHHREEIQNSVKNGVGTKYSQDDVNNFNKVFQDRFPTKDQINNLHPELRDAANALKTSRAIETYLDDTMKKNEELAKKTGALAGANALRDGNVASLGDGGKGASRTGRSSTDGSSSGGEGSDGYQRTAGGVRNGRSSDMHDTLSSFQKGTSVETKQGGLDPEDKSLLAGMLRGLQDDLSRSASERDTKDAGKGSGGEGLNGASGADGANGIASLDVKGLPDPASVGGGAGAGKRSPASSAAAAGLDPSLIEISIFKRVHFRIETRAARDGLTRRN